MYNIAPDVTSEQCFAEVSPEDLDALRVRCVVALAPHLAGYPWQLERFELRSSHNAAPPSQKGADKRGAPPCLWGTLRFGDAVDDEWFAHVAAARAHAEHTGHHR